jgi:hypothetical protein
MSNQMEPDPKKWCGVLLAFACYRGEIECNLPKGHPGRHEHVWETEIEAANSGAANSCEVTAKEGR